MIRNLSAHLQEHQLVQSCPLSALSDTRLGIDLPHYLQILLRSPSTREPLVAMTGGLPLALTSLIETDLRSLEKLRIKPVFVCPGLPLASRPPGRTGSAVHGDQTRESAMKREAWENYENGRVDDAVRILEGVSWVQQRDLMRLVLRIFRHRNVEFLVAPYSTTAQLIYLLKHTKGYIHSIYGPHEPLLYPNGLDRLILSLDLSSSTITFVSKPALLTSLGHISEEQFLDFGLLSGCEGSLPFPPLIPNGVKALVDSLKQFKSGSEILRAYLSDPQVKELGYSDLYMRARSAIKFALVFTGDEGRCVPLPLALAHQNSITAADIPQDMHELFSHRLPDEVYFHLARGLVSPQSVGWLTSGLVVEDPPLDNGDSTEYRRFVQEVVTEGFTSPRCTALALVSSVLIPGFWPKRKVSAYYYFDPQPPAGRPPNPGRLVPHGDKQTLSLVGRCLEWHVPCVVVEEELRRQNSSTIDFALCLGATAEEQFASRTRKPKPPPAAAAGGGGPSSTNTSAAVAAGDEKPLEKKDEIVANVIWRFLDLRGFLHPNHLHGPLAQALHAGIKSARINDKFQEPLFLALELTRAGVLHGDLWSGKSWSGGPHFGDEEEKRCMLLVMRVLSIVPLQFKNQQWSGPLSRELLVFNSFLKSLSRSLRHLLEAVSLHMVLRNDARRVRDDFLDISLSLPFQADTNTGFGVLAKTYLDSTIAYNEGVPIKEGEGETEDAKDAKEAALESVEENFGGVKNPRAEVERGFRFWDAVLVAIRSLAANQGRKNPNALDIQQHVVDQFEAAEKWLRPMRP